MKNLRAQCEICLRLLNCTLRKDSQFYVTHFDHNKNCFLMWLKELCPKYYPRDAGKNENHRSGLKELQEKEQDKKALLNPTAFLNNVVLNKCMRKVQEVTWGHNEKCFSRLTAFYKCQVRVTGGGPRLLGRSFYLGENSSPNWLYHCREQQVIRLLRCWCRHL